jgi:hypothetical protein
MARITRKGTNDLEPKFFLELPLLSLFCTTRKMLANFIERRIAVSKKCKVRGSYGEIAQSFDAIYILPIVC